MSCPKNADVDWNPTVPDGISTQIIVGIHPDASGATTVISGSGLPVVMRHDDTTPPTPNRFVLPIADED